MSGFDALSSAAQAARSTRPAVPLAIATLVGVRGSSYRQPGARLLVDAEGRVLAGAISGGCLEGDVAAHAAAACESGQAIRLVYDLRDDLEAIWGFGSACDGVATIVLEPLLEREVDGSWLRQADDVRRSRKAGTLITHAGEYDTPSLGTIAIVDGDVMHSLHDGASKWRGRIVNGAAIAARTAHSHAESIESDTLFFEPLLAPIALNIIGAGRGAEAFAHIATTLGWETSLADHRHGLLDSLSLPSTVRVIKLDGNDVAGAMHALPTDGRTAVALLTHIFDTDLAWLSALLPSPCAYIGVLGSRQRAAKLVERVRASGAPITLAMLQRLHAPIGLDLGGEDPASIALAAIAEIEAVMHRRPGGSLRGRQSPIHERSTVPSVSNQ
ncbi:MAG: XdhC family protein [Gemmatimonas sp.]